MTLVQETNIMFYTAIVIAVVLAIHLYGEAKKSALLNYCFQRTRMHIARQLKEGYDSNLAILMNNMSKDLVYGRPVSFKSIAKKLGKKYFGNITPRDGLLCAEEQAKVMTWLLNHETYPQSWKVKKIRLYRTMPELIAIAKANPHATQNEMMLVLAAA